MYQHIKRPSEFDKETIINVFVKGIKPMWEDPEHSQGGAWSFCARKGHSDMLWENLLLGLIGEQFELAYEVTGIVVHASAADVDKF